MDTIKEGTRIFVRSARDDDRPSLATLIHFSPHVHRHLDWCSPLDWLGADPYLVAERNGQIVAALACPADIPEMAWIRLFAVSATVEVERAWRSLWPQAKRRVDRSTTVSVLPLQKWFQVLLTNSEFSHNYNVAVLDWQDTGQNLSYDGGDSQTSIRMMNYDDLVEVHQLDKAGFDPVWRHSLNLLQVAYRNSAYATVVEDEKGIIGYQISTENSGVGHLARLCVPPHARRQGVGSSLVFDLLRYFRHRGIDIVTVNTQTDNQASKALYRKTGFQRTGDVYPIYQA